MTSRSHFCPDVGSTDLNSSPGDKKIDYKDVPEVMDVKKEILDQESTQTTEIQNIDDYLELKYDQDCTADTFTPLLDIEKNEPIIDKEEILEEYKRTVDNNAPSTVKASSSTKCMKYNEGSSTLQNFEKVFIKPESGEQAGSASSNCIGEEKSHISKCAECNYQTDQKRYLKAHLLRHKNPEEIDWYKCVQCEFRTARKEVQSYEESGPFNIMALAEQALKQQSTDTTSIESSAEKQSYEPSVPFDYTALAEQFLQQKGTTDITPQVAVGKQVESSDEGSIDAIETEYTKKGEKRKRKKYKYSPAIRKIKQNKKLKQVHSLRAPCNSSCQKKCVEQVNHERRTEINSEYWDMSKYEQKLFVTGSVLKIGVKRKTVDKDSRRTFTHSYFLKNEYGESIAVCRTFFLTTLGYHRNNDKILENMFITDTSIISPEQDRRCGRIPSNKKDHQIIIDHIESFKPNLSTYKHEHAPLRRYLPSDLSAQALHGDFLSKTPGYTCSYDLYRSILRELNISFAKTGQDECELCKHFKSHGHSEENLFPDCTICLSWKIHREKYDEALKFYESDKLKFLSSDDLLLSVDLQKVIMLPRCDTIKALTFTQRLVIYNESFVPVKSTASKEKPLAMVWHEAVGGRTAEDIISVFNKFLQNQRDRVKVTFWLNDYSEQHKSWEFLSFLVFIINSDLISTYEIVVNYFEPGHNFMSVDSFHHRVEKSLKTFKNIYDFDDFKTAVESTKSRVLEMNTDDFLLWKDHSKSYEFKIKDKIYLQDIVQVSAVRGSFYLNYKTDFNQDALPLDFLKQDILKTEMIPPPEHMLRSRGISTQRRNDIINLLTDNNNVVPPSRIEFWKNIPLSTAAESDEVNNV